LVLAATGLALSVRADLRDERGELDELEAQGASPSSLRRVVRLRALVLTVGGVVAGALTGVLLVTLVTRVVSVTARGGFAEPPLAATVEIAVVAAGFAAFVLLAAALVAVATHGAFASGRGPAFREEG
jgi:ABC-type antimicrobial peptide transport system permease subunit